MGDDWWNPKREVEPPTDDWPAGPPPPADMPPPGMLPPYPAPPWVEPPRYEPPPQRRSKTLVGALGGLGVIVGVIAVKVAIGFLAGSVVGTIASAFFGGPFDRLPADARQAYEQRLQAAIGPRLDGLSKTEADARLQGWISGGLLRMDDARLVRRLQLEVSAVLAADEQTCAAVARQAFVGDVSSDMSRRVIGALDTEKLDEWIGLNVEAIEIELRAAPAQKRVSDAEVNNAFDRLIQSLPDPTSATISNLANRLPASDADACTAVRNFYGAAVSLDERSRSVIARYDVQAVE